LAMVSRICSSTKALSWRSNVRETGFSTSCVYFTYIWISVPVGVIQSKHIQ
jgi:hypothetical protein